MQRDRYPAHWNEIALQVKTEANWKCEERLVECNQGFREVVITEASPLACPVEKDLSKSQFCEKFGTVANWIE